MRRSTVALLVLLLSAGSVSSFGAEGMWGSRGISQRFLTRGTLLYAAEGRGVVVYDVADPTAIRRIDVELAYDETRDVAFLGSGELVAATRRGFDHFAIAPDGTVTRLTSVTHAGPADRIAASDRYVAIAAERDLTVLERSGAVFNVIRSNRLARRILAITFVGSYLYVALEQQAVFVFSPSTGEQLAAVPGSINAFALSGSTLWGGSFNQGLVALDVGNPATPRILSTTGSEELRLSGVAASGTRVYGFEEPFAVFDGGRRTFTPGRILLFDGSSPERPELAATMNEWADVIAAAGTSLFVSGAVRDDDGLRYETGAPVRAFNATSLSAPAFSGEFRDHAGPVSGVWTDGSIAYVVDPPFFRVLDVSTTAAPREIRAIHLSERAQQSVRVKDGMAIVYGRELVHLVDVTSPLEPVHAGTWATQGRPPSDAALLGARRFVEANDHSGLHVVDFTTPASAYQVGGRIWHYHSVAAGDDAIYALQQSLFLTLEVGGAGQVIDRDAVSINGSQIESSPPNVARPDYVVIRQPTGMTVYTLANRFSPVQIGFLPWSRPGVLGTGNGYTLFESEGILHRAALGSVSTPMATTMRVTAPMQISVAGEKVVIADRYSVRVFGPDTAPPEEPPPPPPPPPGRRRSVGH